MKSEERSISRPFIVTCVPEIVALFEDAQVNKVNTEIELLNYKESITILELTLSIMTEGRKGYL